MALGRLVKALEKFFSPKIEHLYVLLKNDLRMVLGRLVKTLEKFFGQKSSKLVYFSKMASEWL